MRKMTGAFVGASFGLAGGGMGSFLSETEAGAEIGKMSIKENILE